MKTLNRIISIATLALAVIAIPTASFAYVQYNGAYPSVTALGVQTLTYNQATVNVSYNAQNATYAFSQTPTIAVSYTNLQTGARMITSSDYETGLSETQTFFLNDLQPSTQYSYQAILSFQGMTLGSNSGTFTTPANPHTTTYVANNGGQMVLLSNGTVVNASSLSASQAASYFPITTPALSAIANTIGATAVKNAVINTIQTGTTVHANGVILAITDTQATVSKGDTVTYTVTYRNTNAASLSDAILQVQLPSQYAYLANSNQNASYTDSSNIVSFGLGTINSGATHTFTFQAQATGTGSGTVVATGTLSYNGGSVTATDHDNYNGGAASVLGASVFGAGFFPQTFGGWLIIVLIIAAIVIIARRYVLAPKPAPAQAK